jgi:peptide subunit release factor 1 (eRF1)
MKHSALRRVAIWIDHREALLVAFVADQLQREEELVSEVRPHTHGGGWSQHRFEAHRHETLKHFYEEVIQHLGMVDEILILGPGQAKHELRARIEHHKGLKGKVVEIASADQLTAAELVAQAKGFFKIDLD